MDHKQFIKNLKVILTIGQKQQQLIHESAMFALESLNVGKTAGKDSPMQKMWDTINMLKSVNRQAFMDWATEFGYCRFAKQEDGNFLVKFVDKSTKMSPTDSLLLANETPFYEFAKEPEPNLKPFNVFDALKAITTHATNAATGGKKGDKPIRQIERKELLDVINYIVANPESAIKRLGLANPSKEVQATIEEQVFTPENFAELQELIQKAA